MTLSYLALFLFTLFALYPISRLMTTALERGDQLPSTSRAITASGPTLANFDALLVEIPVLRWLGNSILVSLVVAITGLALASAAGYSLARFRFVSRGMTLKGLLVTHMFPATILLLPLYLILVTLGLINSSFGVVIAIYAATALPFCIWQMKSYYDAIPFSLEEAARIDGATPGQAFRLVILPIAAPAMVITAFFSFMTAWNEYLVVTIVLQDMGRFALPVGLKIFQSNVSTQWGLYAVGALLVSIPVVILFLVLSRFLIPGISSRAPRD